MNMNSRTSGIMAELQRHRAERKKPKRAAPLKAISLDSSQKVLISNVQRRAENPPILKKNAGRNSAVFSVSMGFHILIALILGPFFITEQIQKDKEAIGFDMLVKVNKPQMRRLQAREQVKFSTKQPETQKLDVQKPVKTAAALPLSDEGFSIPHDDTVGVGTPEISAEKLKLIDFDRDVARPVGSEQVEVTQPKVNLSMNQASAFGKLDKLDKFDDAIAPLNLGEISIEGNKVIPPKYKYKRKPDYPESARQAEIEEEVLLQARIDENGIPQDIIALTAVGYGLEEAAIAALQRSTFIPAMKNGKVVSLTVKIPYDFKLED